MYKKIIILTLLFTVFCAYNVSAIDSYILRILSPNGGENLTIGQTFPITWTQSPNISNVTIGYSGNNGVFGTIASHIGASGFYNWVVDIGNTLPFNSQVYIWIAGYQNTLPNAVIFDTTDQPFNVWIHAPTPTIIPTATPTPICPPCPKGMVCSDVCYQNGLK